MEKAYISLTIKTVGQLRDYLNQSNLPDDTPIHNDSDEQGEYWPGLSLAFREMAKNKVNGWYAPSEDIQDCLTEFYDIFNALVIESTDEHE